MFYLKSWNPNKTLCENQFVLKTGFSGCGSSPISEKHPASREDLSWIPRTNNLFVISELGNKWIPGDPVVSQANQMANPRPGKAPIYKT